MVTTLEGRALSRPKHKRKGTLEGGRSSFKVWDDTVVVSPKKPRPGFPDRGFNFNLPSLLVALGPTTPSASRITHRAHRHDQSLFFLMVCFALAFAEVVLPWMLLPEPLR